MTFGKRKLNFGRPRQHFTFKIPNPTPSSQPITPMFRVSFFFHPPRNYARSSKRLRASLSFFRPFFPPRRSSHFNISLRRILGLIYGFRRTSAQECKYGCVRARSLLFINAPVRVMQINPRASIDSKTPIRRKTFLAGDGIFARKAILIPSIRVGGEKAPPGKKRGNKKNREDLAPGIKGRKSREEARKGNIAERSRVPFHYKGNIGKPSFRAGIIAGL